MLTEKQRRFVDEYIIDSNAIQAAVRSGYAYNTARYASDWLNPNDKHFQKEISETIQARLKEMESQRIADASEVMRYLTSVMRGESMSQEIAVVGLGGGLSEATVMNKAPSEKDKLKAAELIGKRFGIFSDKLNLEANVTAVVVDDLSNSNENE